MILDRYKFIGVILFFFFTVSSYAQIGSPYSLVGIGDVIPQGYGQSKAMGGIGIGHSSRLHLNGINPSTLVELDSLSVIYELGVSGGFNNIASSTSSTYKTDTRFDYLALGFRLREYWGLSLGLAPVSRLDYTFSDEVETTGIEPYTEYYYGTGGISKVYLTNSFKIVDNLTVGIEAAFLFGSVDRINLIELNDYTNNIKSGTNSKYEYKFRLNDFVFRYGLQYKIPLKDDRSLKLGVIYENKKKVKASISNTAITTYSAVYTQGVEYDIKNSAILDTIFMEEDKSTTMTYPSSFGFGFTYVIENKLTVGADIEVQNWKELDAEGMDKYSYNSWSYKGGVEYIPDSKSISSYLKHVSYRMGGNFNNSQISIDGQRINSYGITAGLGLPMQNSRTSFNITGEFGKRGTTSNNLLEETYGIISLNLSLSDVWFFKRKFK